MLEKKNEKFKSVNKVKIMGRMKELEEMGIIKTFAKKEEKKVELQSSFFIGDHY